MPATELDIHVILSERIGRVLVLDRPSAHTDGLEDRAGRRGRIVGHEMQPLAVRIPPFCARVLVVLQTGSQSTLRLQFSHEHLSPADTNPVQLVALGVPCGIISDIIASSVLADRGNGDIRVQQRTRGHKDRHDPRVRFRLRLFRLLFNGDAVLVEQLKGGGRQLRSGSLDGTYRGVVARVHGGQVRGHECVVCVCRPISRVIDRKPSDIPGSASPFTAGLSFGHALSQFISWVSFSFVFLVTTRGTVSAALQR